MECSNTKICKCPNNECKNHQKCCKCIDKHKQSKSLPYCLFEENKNDKSLRAFYKYLKSLFKDDK